MLYLGDLSTRVTTVEGNIETIETSLDKSDKSTTKTETDNLLLDKLNRRTSGENLSVYSHIGNSQGEVEVLRA